MDSYNLNRKVIVVGSGPAGLMAAELLSASGVEVYVLEKEKRIGKKFLVAGYGGLNLTHSIPPEQLIEHYQDPLWAKQIISSFPPKDFVQWLHSSLLIDTFTGSSGRIFPDKKIKPAQVLSSWVKRLKHKGVKFLLNTAIEKIDYPHVLVNDQSSKNWCQPKAILFALGGASWEKTGSNGRWRSWFPSTDFLPANTGLTVNWSAYFIKKFEGQALKFVNASFDKKQKTGDIIITHYGVESTPIYHISAEVVNALQRKKTCTVLLDIKPSLTTKQLQQKVKPTDSWQTCFNKWNLSALQKALVVEVIGKNNLTTEYLAEKIKSLPLKIKGYRGFNEAISTQGGVPKTALSKGLELKKYPNWWVAGEMLDQDGPTGGFLIQHAVSSARVAAYNLIHKCLMEVR